MVWVGDTKSNPRLQTAKRMTWKMMGKINLLRNVQRSVII